MKNLTVKEIFALAIQNHQKNNLTAAKDLYNKILEIRPDFASAHNNLGVVFERLEQPQKAIDCYKKAIQIDPNYADAQYNLGNAFIKQNEPRKAISYYEKVIQINLI